jgi:hypothetical protein
MRRRKRKKRCRGRSYREGKKESVTGCEWTGGVKVILRGQEGRREGGREGGRERGEE